MTTPQQPPAGWYPDPQDATQQRYWDGTAWTGQTQPAPGATAAGAPIPTAGAPAWAMQPGPGVPYAAKKSWYKRPLLIVPLSLVLVLIVAGVIVAIVQGPDHSKGLERIILQQGQSQLQAGVSSVDPTATAKITRVHCVEDGSSQKYSCLAYFTLTNTSGQTKNFVQHISANSNKKLSATCIWHPDGTPTEATG